PSPAPAGTCGSSAPRRPSAPRWGGGCCAPAVLPGARRLPPERAPPWFVATGAASSPPCCPRGASDQAEHPGAVLPEHLPLPVRAEVEPLHGPHRVRVGVRDVGEVAAEQDAIRQRPQPAVFGARVGRDLIAEVGP